MPLISKNPKTEFYNKIFVLFVFFRPFRNLFCEVGYMHVNSWQTINMAQSLCISAFETCHVNRLHVFTYKLFSDYQKKDVTLQRDS